MIRRRKYKIEPTPIIKEASFASLFALAITFLLGNISFIQEFIKPIKQEFGDFDIYDLVYSSINKGSQKKDKRIILVQYDDSKAEIAKQVRILDSAGPRIIAIDASFENKDDPAGIDSLANSLIACRNIIIGSRIIQNNNGSKIEITKGVFSNLIPNKDFGYINLIGSSDTDEVDVSVKRYFCPMMKISGNNEYAFPCAVSLQYDSAITTKFLKSGHSQEIIDYTGSSDHFIVISKEDLKYFWEKGELRNMIKDKIVILGQISPKKPFILKDLHYTPMNSKLSGKSIPDSYGIVIQANIIAMILDGRSKKLGGKFFSYILAFFASLSILLFYFTDVARHRHPGHWKYFLLTVFSIIVFTYLFLLFFKYLNIKIQLLPIILSMVFSIEFIGIYKCFAKYAAKRWKYKTLFHRK